MEKRSCGTIVDFLLRTGLVIAFLYAATAQMLYPEAWIVWFPQWLGNFVNLNILLYVFSVYEIGLGLWLLSDKKTFYAAVLAALTLLGIIVFNIQALDLIFRDAAILFSALALAVLHYEKQHMQSAPGKKK
ncbi:hypothetical protein HY488_01460 [Candidatus Woesearchaeota archaeon]|nr:hypothetical protein [Candidatus Woesearchaeota archaeon]